MKEDSIQELTLEDLLKADGGTDAEFLAYMEKMRVKYGCPTRELAAFHMTKEERRLSMEWYRHKEGEPDPV